MGAVGSLFGGGGSNNADWQAGAANILNPTTVNQAQGAYGQAQGALGNQQALMQALAAQNGLGNQANAVNQQQALARALANANGVGTQSSAIQQQQMLANQLGANHGAANQQSVFNQQQGLANQLQNIGNGNGPNPAQAMLNQSTGQNISNQAALMASQRGASANPALIAREAAMQGGALQQNAVGQGASLQAQQQLNALGALQNQQASMGNLATGQINQQQAALGQLGGLAGQQVGQQQAAVGQLGGLANQQVANQIGGVQGYNQAAQGEQQNLLNAIGGQNNANVSAANGMNSANSNLAGANAAATANAVGGIASGIGAAAAAYTGGEIESGGQVMTPYSSHLQKVADIYHGPESGQYAQYAHGGQVQMLSGGKVPGKAKMSGDHPVNDTVKAKLSPGEVVIPKSVMESEDPATGAAQFVAALMKKKGGGQASIQNDFKEALGRAMASRSDRSKQ